MQKTQNSTPKTQLIISIVFFCVLLLAFVFLYKEINSNYAESQLKETEWQNEEMRRKGIKALDNLVKTIEVEKKELETHFAHSSDIVPFLGTIENLASRSGAKAEVVSVNILDNQVGLLVSMNARGSFGSLYKFITLLENSSYELEFLFMDLKGEAVQDAEGKENFTWNASLRIKLLSFVP